MAAPMTAKELTEPLGFADPRDLRRGPHGARRWKPEVWLRRLVELREEQEGKE
jgi:hypothetical protein